MHNSASLKHIQTPALNIAYREHGPLNGPPILLLHGFPDDARAWGDVIPPLVEAGYRALAPYLRGFGQTRFLDRKTPRSGQLGALAQDAIDFADALELDTFTLVGHDWGGRAAQAVAVLHAERVQRLISLADYEITYGDKMQGPPPYAQLHALWYQWMLNLPMGEFILRGDRRGFCRYLWQSWSPSWKFDDATFESTARSFDNPDFVDIVIHGYRYGRDDMQRDDAPGDPRYEALEAKLSQGPKITVPTVVIQGAEDGVNIFAEAPTGRDEFFTGGHKRIVLDGVGHFPHREQPQAVVDSILSK